MKKFLTLLLSAVLLAGCRKPAPPVKDDSAATRAGEAALRARKKAEALKNEENKRVKEANDAMNQP